MREQFRWLGAFLAGVGVYWAFQGVGLVIVGNAPFMALGAVVFAGAVSGILFGAFDDGVERRSFLAATGALAGGCAGLFSTMLPAFFGSEVSGIISVGLGLTFLVPVFVAGLGAWLVVLGAKGVVRRQTRNRA